MHQRHHHRDWGVEHFLPAQAQPLKDLVDKARRPQHQAPAKGPHHHRHQQRRQDHQQKQGAPGRAHAAEDVGLGRVQHHADQRGEQRHPGGAAKHGPVITVAQHPGKVGQREAG